MARIELIVTDDAYKIQAITDKMHQNLNGFDSTPMKLNELMQCLDQFGMNIFVPVDAHFYVNGIVRKHDEMEQHIYKCLAYFCTTHSFLHSKFNKMFNRRTCFLEFQNIFNGCMHLARITPLETHLVVAKVIGESASQTDNGQNHQIDVIDDEMVFYSEFRSPGIYISMMHFSVPC